MDKLLNFINKNSQKLLWIFIFLYAVIFSALCIWKYSHFLYNALDLAIINNIFYNTLHGNWFWSTIQGHSYIGDHFTPILILLLPIYWLWQSPEMLLILQSIFIGLAAWPIYRISQLVLKDNIFALGLAFLWLINPLVHNINLYEFHFISLAPFFILMAFYYYLKIKESINSKKYLIYFFIFLFSCFFIREDVAFLILVFSILISFKNKKIYLISIISFIVSAAWLYMANKIISAHSFFDSSPFFYYYNWLGSAGPGTILKHILTYTNLEMMIGFFLPFLFIPLIRPKWLLLALIPLGQIILSAAGGGAQVWQIHYGAMFLPALVLAFIFSFNQANKLINNYFKSKYLLIFILIIINIYLWPSFGIWNSNQIKKAPDFKIISEDSSVMSSFNYLPNLSSRENIYSLHYYFLGVQQFAQAPYTLNKNPEFIILDKDDYEYYDKILKTSAWAGVHYINGYKRLEELLVGYGEIETENEVTLFRSLKN